MSLVDLAPERERDVCELQYVSHLRVVKKKKMLKLCGVLQYTHLVHYKTMCMSFVPDD